MDFPGGVGQFEGTMDHRYRVKYVIIEAFQMREDRRWDNSDWPFWLNEAWNLNWVEKGAIYPALTDTERLMFNPEKLSPEGKAKGGVPIEWGDWVVWTGQRLMLMRDEYFGDLMEDGPVDTQKPLDEEEVRQVVGGLLSSLGMVTEKANELGGDFLPPHHMKWGVRGLALLETMNDEESATTAEGMASVQDGGSRMDISPEGGDSSGQGEDPEPAA